MIKQDDFLEYCEIKGYVYAVKIGGKHKYGCNVESGYEK
jgi:hypothetical protein